MEPTIVSRLSEYARELRGMASAAMIVMSTTAAEPNPLAPTWVAANQGSDGARAPRAVSIDAPPAEISSRR